MKNNSMLTMQGMLMVLTCLALVASLKIAGAIILPLVLSVFLAFLLSPVVQLLMKYKFPEPIAAITALIIGGTILGLLGWLFWGSLTTIQQSLPAYISKLKTLVFDIDKKVVGHGIELKAYIPMVQEKATTLLGMLAGVLIAAAQNSLLIFFITMFILLEFTRFKNKSERAFGPENRLTKALVEIAGEIKRYMLFKSLISLLTGFLVWLGLKMAGLDFPLVWGILAFILNFIPSIGSIVASIPPILLAVLQFDDPIQGALMVSLILGVIQLSIGNYIDPKIMGESLNISPLVIFLSMIFWGWMWGPMGMLIAVPLAVCLKVVVSQMETFRPFGIMMEGK